MLTQCNSGTAPKSTRRRPRWTTRPDPIVLPDSTQQATYTPEQRAEVVAAALTDPWTLGLPFGS